MVAIFDYYIYPPYDDGIIFNAYFGTGSNIQCKRINDAIWTPILFNVV